MIQVFPNKIVNMSARSSNTQQQVEHEVSEERAREQPVAKWRRDSDSVLQLLASPLVSRSPSPVSEADEESTGEISDVELPSEEEAAGTNATEIAEIFAISDESGPEDGSEEEKEGTETVSPEVSPDEDDAARRAARDLMVFRRLSRATAGLGRICLGQIPPSGEPKEWARILEARAVTVRQWEARRVARRAAVAAWQQRLRDAEAEEAALWERQPLQEQPPQEQPQPPQEQLQSPEEQMQPPLPPPRAPTPPPPPPPRSPLPLPRSPSPPPSPPPRQQEWHLTYLT
ncbi:WW domain-binding protein 11-like [Drosophila gunungcola]|uniref:WW domain-binding protein 11-like n=1 Tax=Drosophila gunungcola TaxID=103775 RepID=UPI0022E3CB76|nr:WW domain-binding protein 11-like [Drosophila gunungcola]